MIPRSIFFCFTLTLTYLALVMGCFQQEQDNNINEHNEALALFIKQEVISIEEYQDNYGPYIFFESPVVQFADKIWRVSLNQSLFEPGAIKADEQILFNIKDQAGHNVTIKKIELNEMLSMRGHIKEHPQNIFLLSAQDEAVLASLDIMEENVLYVIITNPQSGNFYLFRTPGDKIERLECGGPLMPPENNKHNQNDRKNDQNNDQNNDRNNDQNSEEPSRVPDENQTLLLFHNLQELSRENYIEKYGKQSLLGNPVAAAADRIGEVTINYDLFEPGLLKTGDYLKLVMFEGQRYLAVIENIAEKAVFTVRARIVKPYPGMLILSFADNKVLATLELAERNTIYLVKYNHFSDKHYLFKAPRDNVERLEGAPSLIPDDDENESD